MFISILLLNTSLKTVLIVEIYPFKELSEILFIYIMDFKKKT
jgi:hypothetical protein